MPIGCQLSDLELSVNLSCNTTDSHSLGAIRHMFNASTTAFDEGDGMPGVNAIWVGRDWVVAGGLRSGR